MAYSSRLERTQDYYRYQSNIHTNAYVFSLGKATWKVAVTSKFYPTECGIY